MRYTLKSANIVGPMFTLLVVGLMTGADDNPSKRRITVHEIENAIVIGKLGVPLGEIATIVGRWEDVDKGHDRLVVSEVNGKRLEQPVEFIGDLPTYIGYNDEPKNPLAFERTYRLRVYESAGFWGMDPKWFAEAQAGVPQSMGFAFRSQIKVLRDVTQGEQSPVRRK